MYRIGDRVIFRKSKHSACPGPRAHDIVPSSSGEDYSYLVDKFWTVIDVIDNESIICVTPGGKRHQIAMDHPNLRRANWLERWLFTNRFPELESESSLTPSQAR